MIRRNTLIEWQSLDHHEQPPKVDRVLDIVDGKTAWVINIWDTIAWPRLVKLSDLNAAILDGSSRILHEEPLAKYIIRAETDIDETQRDDRDDLFNAFQVAFEAGHKIYVDSDRILFTKQVARLTGRTEKNIRKFLRRYLQAGEVINALLPHYLNSGASGKPRKSKGKRLGSFSKEEIETKSPKGGIPITDEIQNIFRSGIELFYHNKGEHSLKSAYQRTMERFFNIGFEKTADGIAVPILLPANQRPTFRQFEYWYHKTYRIEQTLTARRGRKEFDANHRPTLGSSTDIASDATDVYAIDRTPLDIKLISSINSNDIVGNPGLYLVIQVRTKLIVGFEVSLENASYLEVVLALHHAFTDKVDFCRRYGIEIDSSDWPSGICKVILADRGQETMGEQGEFLARNMGFQISNTAAYRGDLKGDVEQAFNQIREKVIKRLPGATRKHPIKGEAPAALKARLTLDELIHLLTIYTLEYNKNHWIENYPMTAEMAAAGVEPYPLELWNYYVDKDPSLLREEPADSLLLKMLPTGTATVNNQGIEFEGLRYSCDLAVSQGWFVEAGYKGTWNIEIAYHPHYADVIYIRPKKELGITQMERCELNTNNLIEAAGRSFAEVKEYLDDRNKKMRANQDRHDQSRAVTSAYIDHTVKGAEQRFRSNFDGRSKNARLNGIKENKDREIQLERERNQPNLFKQAIQSDTQAAQESESNDESNLLPYNPVAKFRKALKGKQEGNNDEKE